MSPPFHCYSILVFPTFRILYSISIGSKPSRGGLEVERWSDKIFQIHTLQYPLKVYEIDSLIYVFMSHEYLSYLRLIFSFGIKEQLMMMLQNVNDVNQRAHPPGSGV